MLRSRRLLNSGLDASSGASESNAASERKAELDAIRPVYDYDAQDADELSFKDGEIIYSVDQLDPGWWAGESEDGLRRGVFPSNFQDLGANHAVALFDYEAAEDGELSFKEGDQITHIDLVSGDWWEGVNAGTGAQGLFPANHVELV
ncbi:actin binding protein [Coemansia helicoidea]|uniref:Actin binding protein n=1 Tax=Coemansia helicoidea TaxID=1286919 RepID=A0ACC1L0W3_9FUNG|nr:actin binding protein [Coemansia helicoidea]